MNKHLFQSFCAALSLSALSAQAQSSAYEIATWEDFKDAAITFTFDDNLSNQYRTAVPIFDKYGFKGSFFVVTNWMNSGNGYSWANAKQMLANGHEIGSHTVSHGSLNSGNYVSEMANSQSTIDQQLGKGTATTIVYPNCVVPSSTSECAKYYLGGRICNGQVEGSTPRDYFQIGSLICGNQGSYNSLNDMTGACNNAKNKKGWAVFLLHEIDNGSGYSPFPSSVLEQTLSYLNQNKNTYWVATFGSAIRYSKERNAAKVNELTNTANEITLTLTDNLDNNSYNYPLTIRRTAPSGWTEVKVSQGSNSSNVNVSNGYIYFKAVPDAGTITLEPAVKEVVPTGAILTPAEKVTWDAGTTQEISWQLSGTTASTNILSWETAGSGTISATGAEASSTWCTDDKSFCWDAANITSEDEQRWAAGNGTYAGEWVAISLGKKATVGGAIIDECTSQEGTISSFEIQYDNGNGEWQTAYTGTTIGAMKSFSFEPVTATKLRLYIKAATNVNVNYFAALSMSAVDLKKEIGASGTYTWQIPAAYAGTSGKLVLKTKNGSLIAESAVVTIAGKQAEEGGETGGDTPGAPVAGTGSFFDGTAYFGPSCNDNGTQGTGAYFTGNYTSPFKTYLGKSDADIQGKLDQLWNHYFVNGTNKVYFDKGNEAYIFDTGNSDVRSEGMSYGMMIAVQTDHREEFDKLWAFAKNHMLHRDGQWAGYFAWQCGTDGTPKDQNCAPDGEMYFTMSLLFAANRWGNDGKFNYQEDAQFILKNMWKGNNGSLFNETHNVVTFQPYNCSDFSDPSYDLPAFVDLFSRWSNTNNARWETAAAATRNHLIKSSNPSSGLFSDYNNFDGTPKSVSYNNNSHRYMYDAMRCAMNVGMDYYLFGTDAKNQTTIMTRLINFFEKDGYKHARFDWDGSNPGETYTLGETGANAVGCFALMGDPANDSKVKTNLNKAWSAGLATGQYRYYDGLVHYLSMLHLCGSFKIWKPAPTVEQKTVEGKGTVTYQGVEYKESTTISAFEDCQLYEVSIEVSPDASGVDNAAANNALAIAPNPSNGNFSIAGNQPIAKVELLNLLGQPVAVSHTATLSAQAPAGTYLVRITTASGNVSVLKAVIK